MKLLDWLFGKQDPEFRFIGHVKRDDGQEPYLSIFVEDCFVVIETRHNGSIRLDRKCLRKLTPLLEEAALGETE